MKPANLLFFISDNHARSEMGCSGNPVITTPVLRVWADRRLVPATTLRKFSFAAPRRM